LVFALTERKLIMKILQIRALPLWLVFAAFAAQGSTPTVIKDNPPPFYCPDGGPSTSKFKGCEPFPKMPASASKDKRPVAIVGLIKGAEHVALIRGKARDSLCFTGVNWKRQRETTCKGVANAKPLPNFDIMPVNVNGVHALVFKRKPNVVANKNELADLRQFTVEFGRAAVGLQKIADKRLLSSTAPTALKKATPGLQASAVMVPGSGGCGSDEDGGGFCTTPADGYEGGGGGGDYGAPEYDPGYPEEGGPVELPGFPPPETGPIPDGGAAPNWPSGSGSGGEPVLTSTGWVCTVTIPTICYSTANRPAPTGGIPPIGGIPPVGGPIGGDGSGWFPPSGPITNAPPADNLPENARDKWNAAVKQCNKQADDGEKLCNKMAASAGWDDDKWGICFEHVINKQTACVAIANAQYGNWYGR
jgi:hypothetical protein